MKNILFFFVIIFIFNSSYISAQSLNEIDSILKKSPLDKSNRNIVDPGNIQKNASPSYNNGDKRELGNIPDKTGNQNTKKELGGLNEYGRSSTVLIFTYKKNEIDSVGSGFFISDNLILTNSHVVDGADQFEVITSRGERKSVNLIANGVSGTGNDFAILEGIFDNKIIPVHITSEYSPLESVYAFGFPVIAIRDDANFQALINGDTKVLPNLVSSSGNIQQIRKNNKNIEVILHSAKISGGNSGGPLIDQCGRAVGINTYIINEQAEVKMKDGSSGEVSVASGYDFSLSGREIINFLNSRKIKFEFDSNICQ